MSEKNELIIKLSKDEQALLKEILKIEKEKYEVFFKKSEKKPKEYNLIFKLLNSIQQINYQV